ncbi:MAG: DUF3489 domain-containing protein [Rhodobacteraceae bacterium]|jgi:hypothetical protein|nr:DUF3489 domain-containing protein [Paracoccaceae bacterium]
MTKLSDTQLVILSAAAQRDDHNVLPLPGSLRGGGEPRPPKGRVGPSSGRSKGANAKVVGALLKRGLIAETTTDSRTKADAALNRIWRNDEEGNAILLHITNAGLAAIGVEPGGGDNAPPGADEAPSAEPPQDAPAEPDPAPKARTPRTGTKQETLIAMLRAEGGATIDEIVAALDWQAHTARGAMSGALKKKLGLAVTSEKVAGRARRYRLPAV